MLSIRPATLDDGALLVEWRNHPMTRAMSRNTEIVDLSWFERSLGMEKRLLYVVERHGVPIGTVHFDLEGDSAEISMTVAPAFRGRGLASAIVSRAIEEVMTECPSVHNIVAQIKPENARSIRCFERAGFEHVGSEDDLLNYRLVIAS
jgi:RimJ/RimL family protein N-acetyltransferase